MILGDCLVLSYLDKIMDLEGDLVFETLCGVFDLMNLIYFLLGVWSFFLWNFDWLFFWIMIN